MFDQHTTTTIWDRFTAGEIVGFVVGAGAAGVTSILGAVAWVLRMDMRVAALEKAQVEHDKSHERLDDRLAEERQRAEEANRRFETKIDKIYAHLIGQANDGQ
jgi:hypothetical protein